MANIVEKLLDFVDEGVTRSDQFYLRKDAADEIERLQSLLEAANAYGAGENKARIEAEKENERLRAEIVTLRNAAVNADEQTDMLRGKLATAVLAHIDATAESDLLRVEVAALKKDAERNP